MTLGAGLGMIWTVLRPNGGRTPLATISTKPASLEHPTAEVCRVRSARLLLAALGVGCVGMAGVGVVVPGLPTTVFLIVASWCFARSCPWLTDRLIHNRVFGPFVRYLVPGAVMPRRAKAVAMGLMWAAIAGSCWLIVARGAPAFVPAVVILTGVAGTWCIARQGRAARRRLEEIERTRQHPLGRSVPTHKNPACTNTTAARSKPH